MSNGVFKKSGLTERCSFRGAAVPRVMVASRRSVKCQESLIQNPSLNSYPYTLSTMMPPTRK